MEKFEILLRSIDVGREEEIDGLEFLDFSGSNS